VLESENGNKTAAVIVETIGGAAGPGIVPPAGYYAALREHCNSHGVLLIADEVLCGMGRTGNSVAMRDWSCLPDILVLGKGLGAGYAEISAVVLRDSIRLAIESGSRVTPLIHTYAGNPLAVAAANAVIDVYRKEDLVGRARSLGEVMLSRLEELQKSYPEVLNVRGRGCLIGVELSSSASQGDRTTTSEFLANAREFGILLYPCNGFISGDRGDGFFVAPPLNSSNAEINYLLSAIESTLEARSPKMA
jgi:adenosylmethionine-8-amino-7-oxononanoate aminotransferase